MSWMPDAPKPIDVARALKAMTYAEYRELVETIERNRMRCENEDPVVSEAQIFFGMERLQNAIDFIIGDAESGPVSASQ